MTVVAAATAALLVVFTVRRVLLLAASLAGRSALPELGDADLPPVTMVVPAHNEVGHAGDLLGALETLDYPRDRLSFVLVCDGCTDGTDERFRAWAKERPQAQLVDLPRRGGKAAALNAGLVHAEGEIVVVLDADLRPRPDLVRRLAAAFADPSVGAAAGFIKPRNPEATLVARYSTLNALVHQLVTSAAKDRLGLNPPTLGASAYRRSALRAIGDFSREAVGEDVEATVALTRAAWTTRFVEIAVAENDVTETLRGYWSQHLRWTRATIEARSRRARSRARLSPALRAEEWMLTVGNGDRVVLLAALLVALVGALPLWVPLAYLVLPALQAATALGRAGLGRRLPAFGAAALLMIPLDVAASVVGVIAVAARRRETSR